MAQSGIQRDRYLQGFPVDGDCAFGRSVSPYVGEGCVVIDDGVVEVEKRGVD